MCVTVLGVEMQAATVPAGLPTCGAMNSGVCAELLQPLGFAKFLLSLQHILGSGDTCICSVELLLLLSTTVLG